MGQKFVAEMFETTRRFSTVSAGAADYYLPYMSDIAETIARGWYLGMGLMYEGVDIGKTLEYDVLQIVNRMILESRSASSSIPQTVDK